MYIFYLAMIKFTNVLILSVSIAFNKFVKAPAITRARVLYSNNNQNNPNNLRCNPAMPDYDYYACYNIDPDIIYPQTQQQINQDHATTQVAVTQEPDVHEDKSYAWTRQTEEPTVEQTPSTWEYADYVTGNGETAHEQATYYDYITDEEYVSDGVKKDYVYDNAALFQITDDANAENEENQHYEHTGDREATEDNTHLKLKKNDEYDEALPHDDVTTFDNVTSPSNSTIEPTNTTFSMTTYSPSTVIIWADAVSPSSQSVPPDIGICSETSKCRFPFGYPENKVDRHNKTIKFD